ncbi:hypothetical protein QZH41_013214 [Actinostola sp. cb2023]|nr:hypothetical protein QZH41_013214 [Actinostola sp. cb2023]
MESYNHSDDICYSHSKITAPIEWKQVYGEYLGKGYEVPQGMVGFMSHTPLRDIKDVTSTKKDQRRVHFEDQLEDNKDEEEKKQKNGCLPDCYLCQSMNNRKTSPPYQVLPGQMVRK